jgi:hypothetical protein
MLTLGTQRAARAVPMSSFFYEKKLKKLLDFLKNFRYTIRNENE